MNKDLLNQLPADEQPVASQLDSIREDMQLSPSFQWELENQLMDTAKKKMQPAQSWLIKIMAPMAWAVLAVGAVFLLNRTVRSLAPASPPTGGTSDPEISFASRVRQGEICTGPLTLAHDFSVSLTNQDKTGFTTLEVGEPADELRTFAWSPDGRRLAIVANKTGRGQIYIKDFGRQLEYVLPTPDVGYLIDIAWSSDGKQFLMRSVKSRSTVYLVNADGTGSVEEKPLNAQFFETPQIAPDNKSILFNGDATFESIDTYIMGGLVQLDLASLKPRIIGMAPPIQAEHSFAWSPDGSRLAYFEMLDLEVRLVVEAVDKGKRVIIASLPIPKGRSWSLLNSINLSWSPDGKSLVFEFADEATDHAIYLAYADGTEPVKLVDSAHAPAISTDGRCLAYISNDQVFLMDLAGSSLTSPTTTHLLVADLPTRQQTVDIRLDKLQWKP